MDPSYATSAARFLPQSVAAADGAGLGVLYHVVETGSTNADLVERARRDEPGGCVLVADHQRAGRGRLDRRWDDEPGSALLVSVAVPVGHGDAAAVVRSLGAGARAALDPLCQPRVLAKWPNDLVVVGGAAPGKLAGVLAEFVDGPSPCVVAGIGINLAPIPTQPGSTSLAECAGEASRDEVLAAVLREFGRRIDDPAVVLEELRAHSATLGARVRVELAGGSTLQGDAMDLNPDGQLIVVGDDGERHLVSTGDVIRLRSS